MRKRIVIVCMSLTITLCTLGSRGTYAWDNSNAKVQTAKVTSASIEEKEDQISQAQKEKEKLRGSLTNLKEIKKKLESQKSDLKFYVSQLDAALEEIQDTISELKDQILEKEEEIKKVEQEFEEAKQIEEEQKNAMIQRIRMMYEQKDVYATELILDSAGFKDMVNRADYMENIMDYDKRQWEDFQETRKLVALCKEEVELEKEILNQTKANVEAEEAGLEELIEQKKQDIVAYETDISNQERAIKEYEAEIAAQDAEIRMLEQAIAEERQQLLAQNGNVITYDGGMFKFPLASYTRISDDYGMRIHPTLHVEKFHNGVDFASSAGTAIYAAYDGQVVAASYSPTMGNYIMIDHGDSLFTIYMHASKLYVNSGTMVARGDTIAAVGSTGRSTGNHLHFGVRKDGSYVSPWNYISK